MVTSAGQQPTIGAPASPRSTAQFGVIVFLASDVMLFAPFFAAYFLLRATNEPWPPEGVELDVLRAFARHARAGRRRRSPSSPPTGPGSAPGGERAMRRWLLVTIALGAVFLANQILEYATLDFGADDHPYGSIYWLLTGLHGAHVTAGLAAMALLFVRAGAQPQPRARRHVGRRGLAVLAPRRRHLGLRVHDDLGTAVNVLLRPPAPPRPPWPGSCRFTAPSAARRPARHRRPSSAPSCTSTQCASCHGVDGEGVEDRGPPLTDEGPAAVDFVLRTGRMPMAAPNMQATARPGPLQRDGDPRPRRLRRRVRRRPGHPRSSIRPPATSPPAASCTASTAPPATWRPVPGRRSAAGARRRR